MKIRKIEIERFRGIQTLDWNVGGEFICLVGPGDSTKSTILDAIDLALTARWNVQFDDTDFYDANTDNPIKITITLTEIPNEIKSDAKFGLLSRGWTAEGTIRDEPEDGDELALSIQLRVDSSLEPTWAVINDRNPEGKTITSKDRERLGCIRLGVFLDRHFSWGRGSILSRLTGEGDSLSSILANASRAARAALDGAPSEQLTKLREAAEGAKTAGAAFGVAATVDYHPRLDVDAVSVGVGGLSLHDGAVPLRRAGLGTRRLLAVAMQREAAKESGVTLIDEVEHGLEPHRIRHLLRVLRKAKDQQSSGPVFMTTHAPVALGELKAKEIRIVRAKNGVTSVLEVDPELQRIVLRASEAFFARKVLVCEGDTELGFCRKLDEWWSEDGKSFALMGVALAGGGGSEASMIALKMAHLGFEVALLGDSDRPINPDRATLEGTGIKVILWEGNVAIEERLTQDLPWEGVAEIIRLATDWYGEQSVRDAIAGKFGISPNQFLGPPLNWIDLGLDEMKLRAAVGISARLHNKGWFKRVDLGEDLASVVIGHFSSLLGTDTEKKIGDLRNWAYSGG